MEQSTECKHIESLICQSKFVQSCVVVGHDQPYLSALIAPDKATLSEVLPDDDSHSKHNLDTYRGLNHIEVRCHYCDILEQVNKQLGEKKIDRFALIEMDAAKSRDTLCVDNKLILESFYQEFLPGIG
jgi:long-subunit acyl-CoA synthetase (AMP-forming)